MGIDVKSVNSLNFNNIYVVLSCNAAELRDLKTGTAITILTVLLEMWEAGKPVVFHFPVVKGKQMQVSVFMAL